MASNILQNNNSSESDKHEAEELLNYHAEVINVNLACLFDFFFSDFAFFNKFVNPRAVMMNGVAGIN